MVSLCGAQGLIWPKSVVIKDALHDRHIDLINKGQPFSTVYTLIKHRNKVKSGIMGCKQMVSGQHFLTSVKRPLDTLWSLHTVVFLIVLDKPVKHCVLQIRVKHCLYWLGLSTVSKPVRFFCWVGVDAMCTLIIYFHIIQQILCGLVVSAWLVWCSGNLGHWFESSCPSHQFFFLLNWRDLHFHKWNI